MKKDKRQHGKKSYSFRRKKARAQTSSSVSSEATCCMLQSSNKQHRRHSSTISSVSTSSSSRSSCIRKKATRSDFLLPLKLRPEEKSKSIAFYIDNREEMVSQMFASLHRRELYELLPENLKKLEIAELRYLCVKELNGMSKKNIYSILKGKDFAGSSESEEEKNETLIINANIKTSKAEIAVADSTTEMTAPNLPGIFHAVDTGDAVACSSIISTPEVHCAAVGSISSTKIRQESETVVQSHFPIEHRISFSSNECAEIFASEDALNANRQTTAIITTENDDELEDGEVVSDQERSSNSDKDAIADEDQNCQNLTIHRNLFTDKAQNDLSLALMPKNSGNLCSSGNSTDTTNKVREEKKLHMLELELRARAIEALIRRNDNKP